MKAIALRARARSLRARRSRGRRRGIGRSIANGRIILAYQIAEVYAVRGEKERLRVAANLV